MTSSKEPSKGFNDYLEERGIRLQPWQAAAAHAFLLQFPPAIQTRACGKSFLVKVLRDFIDTHGNDFHF